MRENKQLPTPEEVKEIFKYTYLFYTKWIAVKENEWSQLMDEARELEQKYPYELCIEMLLKILDILEETYMSNKTERSENNGG